MKLYIYPASTTCRPVLQFCADEDIVYEQVVVDLMQGEHCSDDYKAINACQEVPVLEEDDGWRLTESSAILKYLADKIGSPTYPHDLRERARVNAMMDWFNTSLYREIGYHLVYPQILPHHQRSDAAVNAGTIAWGRDKTRAMLDILNDTHLGSGNTYLCGDAITLADFFGTGLLTVGELVGNDLSAWPNVQRWLDTVKARPSWAKICQAHAGFIDMLKGKDFVHVVGR